VLPVEAGARQAAIRAKQGLAQGAGGASDHLALVKAFNGWSAARRAGQERGYCSSNFLSSSTMMMVNGMRTQLLGELQVFLTAQHSKQMLFICAGSTRASCACYTRFKVDMAASFAVPLSDTSCVKSADRAVHLLTLIIAPAVCTLAVRPDVHQT